MKIIVTGGGGFIGLALIKRLKEEGHIVTSISRGYYLELDKLGVKHIRVDLLDYNSLRKAMSNMDLVIHTAALAGFWGPYNDYFNTNVAGTNNVIKACLEGGIGHMVFTSSASVVFGGSNIEGLNENIPYPKKPLSAYTATKAIAERAVLQADCRELRTISIRPHLVWGPGDRHLLPRIIDQADSGKLRRIGNGDNLVDTTYIDNCVEAHLCAVSAAESNPDAWGRAYFISDDEPVKLWVMIDKLLEACGRKPLKSDIAFKPAMILARILEKVHSIPGVKRPPRLTSFLVHELAGSHWFDISAAKEILNYKPVITIEEGLRRLNKA